MTIRDRFKFRCALGFGIGVIVGEMITALSAPASLGNDTIAVYSDVLLERCHSPILAFFITMVMSGLLGAVGLGGATSYWVENISLLKATVTHYIFTMLFFFLTSFVCGWFSPSDTMYFLTVALIMSIIYAGLWLFHYFFYKSQITEINEDLERLRKHNHGAEGDDNR